MKKIVILSYPLPFDAPIRRGGGVPVGISAPLWYGKNRMVSLPDGAKISTCFVLTCSTNVTDGRTDRQTDRHWMTAKTALA